MLFIGLLLLRPTGLAGDERSEDLMAGNARDAIMINPAGRRSRSGRWLAVALIALAIFPLISIALDLGWQITVKGIGIFILLGLGMNLLLGLAGVLDLGFAVSFGIGGYVTAILTNRFGGIGALLPQPIDFLFVVGDQHDAGGAVRRVERQLNTALARRLSGRGDAGVGPVDAARGDHRVRHHRGRGRLIGRARARDSGPAPSTIPFAQYYLVFAIVVIAALLSQWLIRSRTGRAWLASSQDELAAASSGINVARYRLLAFVISSALAGLAGALYASNFAYVSPDMVSFNITTMTLTMVVLGGAGSVPGVILGAMLVIGYDKLFLPRLAAWVAQTATDAHRIGAGCARDEFLQFRLGVVSDGVVARETKRAGMIPSGAQPEGEGRALPGFDSTVMRPPRRSIRRCAMASPTPVPGVL